MGKIGQWNKHKFTVTSKQIQSFTELSISGSNETEVMEKGKSQYEKLKKKKAKNISLTVHLNQYTGCKVKTEAIKYVKEARKGSKGYFYLDNKRLFKCKFLLTQADISNVVIAPNNDWISADVALTLVETGKGGKAASSSSSSSGGSSGSGGSGGSGGGSKKSSVRTNSTTTTKSTSKKSGDWVETAKNTVTSRAAKLATVRKEQKTVSTLGEHINRSNSSSSRVTKTSANDRRLEK